MYLSRVTICCAVKNSVLILLSFLLYQVQSIGQPTHKWVRTNPGGGGAFSTIEAGPTGQIIAGSDLSGAYYSWDFGQSWNIYGAERGLFSTHVCGIGFHPTDEAIFFLGTDAGIYKSSSGGGYIYEVWNQGYITDIGLAPSNTQIGYALFHPTFDSANGAVLKSLDQGETWSQISIDIPNGYRLLELQISHTSPDTLYALAGNGRFACTPAHLLRSTNGGVNWVRLASNLGEIMDVALHPSNASQLYITTMEATCGAPLYYTALDGDFYRSDNGGDDWDLVHSNRTGIIWIKRDDPKIIRMIDPREPWPWIPTGGTWRSIDGGLNWSQTSIGNWDAGYQSSLAWAYGSSYNGFCKTLGESLADPNVLLWTNPQWVFATYDEGVTFNNLHTQSQDGGWRSTGFDNVVMNEFHVNQKNGDILFISFADLGLWRSINRGKSWESCNVDIYTGNWQGFGGNSLTVLSDPARSEVVWTGLQGDLHENAYLLKSTQTGASSTWSLSNSGLPITNRISGLSLDPTSSSTQRTLYVSSDGDIYKSINDGGNWTQVLDNGALHFTKTDAINGEIVYAGGRGGIYKSINGGVDWNDISGPNMIGVEEVDYFDFGFEGVSCIDVHPTQSGWVYITVFHSTAGGVYLDRNDGNGWQQLYANPYMRTIKVNPQNGLQLYAGSSSAYYAGGYSNESQGILYSQDGGNSWNLVNQKMPWPFVTTIDIDRSSPQRVYAGSPGSGIQYAYVGGSHCEHVISLNLPVINGHYSAVETVFSEGTVSTSNSVQIQATQSVILNQGFSVPLGTQLSIDMNLCGQ